MTKPATFFECVFNIKLSLWPSTVLWLIKSLSAISEVVYGSQISSKTPISPLESRF
jgi:hypothetical protein